jgi:hypothetical protein
VVTKIDSASQMKGLEVKMALGAERFRERDSGDLLFPPELRREFPTTGPGQNLSSALVEP